MYKKVLRFVSVAAVIGSLLVILSCSEDSPTATNQPPSAASDFLLADLNMFTPTFGHAISPRDYLQSVSAWYFWDATCSQCQSQLGPIGQLQLDIDSLGWTVGVEFLSVNLAGSLSGLSSGICTLAPSNGVFPRLQDTAEELVWSNWGASHGDIIILDRHNVQVSVFNADLTVQANYDSLKTVLGSFAQGGD